MGGGLVLFGVGAGNGCGGLLNAFTGNGAGSNQKSVVSQQEKTAIKADQAGTPTAPPHGRRWSRPAGPPPPGHQLDYTRHGHVHRAGKKELASTTEAWQRYLGADQEPRIRTWPSSPPAPTPQLGDYAGSANAWEVQSAANPNSAKGYECLAVTAYAAKQTRKGDLALAKALTLVPKAQPYHAQDRIQPAKTNPAVAQQC